MVPLGLRDREAEHHPDNQDVAEVQEQERNKMMQKVTLIPRGMVFPVATPVDSKVLPEYNERIKSYNEKARKSLDIFSDRKGEMAGSNCFAPIILRDLFPESSRLATMYDLERVTEVNPDALKGFYIDTGLVLRTEGDSYKENVFLAKNLAEQLKHRGITLENPKVIYFDALDLEENPESAYGLVYKLNERANLGKNIIDASELTNDFMFKTINEKGIPVKDENGNRNLYTREDGLSRFVLDRDSDVLSYDRYLADSDDDGQVVVIENKQSLEKKSQERGSQ